MQLQQIKFSFPLLLDLDQSHHFHDHLLYLLKDLLSFTLQVF